MFKSKYLLNLVNINSKFLGLILFLLSLLFFKGNILAIIISLLLVVVTWNRANVRLVSLLTLVLSIINALFPHLLWLIKICYLIIYLIYLSDIVDVVNVKKLYEYSLYSLKNNTLMKWSISLIYFLSIFKKNFRKLDKPRVEYGLVTKFGYFIKTIIKSFNVSVSQLKNIILYHKLRFYNIESRRESIDKIEVRNYDHYYVGGHVLVLILSIILRFV